MKRTSVALVVLLIASMLVAPAAHATRIHARSLLPKLPVRAETNVGYDRSKFTLWIDANQDGCNTRAEVLIAESAIKVTSSSSCTVLTGRWLSVFDGKTWKRASDVDIDHHVPLAEPWGSGAKRWSSTQRMRYANDLGYPGSLNAMTDNLNSSKGDRDPADWLPPQNRCKYVIWWVAVKYRWRLAIDSSEKRVLLRFMSSPCGNKVIKLPRRAAKDPGDGGGGGG